MISPVVDLSGAVFFTVGPIAFLMPSNIPLMLLLSEAVWMLSQSWSQKLLAQRLAVH